ncbi:hypothetical protein KTN05_05975 [Paracoccus sp. Z118]|uniref:hypothetical protein n=1 Tax=Paracoccus sp. Z118 TaxID=2851017 RepID=UPI001C2C7D21|nr:hypothetical protein [Paracoccus sp. Z118]MBV0891401.1 hypothetical protein [Paracoccus sp. Z118]
MGPIVGIRELILMLVRHAPLIALVMVAGVIATLSHVMSIPHSYQAITVIQLQPSALQGSGEGSQLVDAPARLRLIEQQVTSRQNVLDMIERHHLFDDRPELTEGERIWLFRQDLRIDLIPSAGAGSADRGVSALLVTANAGSAPTAATLANDVADQIVTGNRSVVTRRMEDLNAALVAEDRRLMTRIAAVEADLDAIRRSEGDALPENRDVLQAELTTLQAQRVATSREIQALERERLMLEVSDGDRESGARAVSLSEQIGRLRIDLAQARRRLGESHPEVQRLQASIDDLQQGGVRDLPPGIQQQIALIDEQLATMEDERTALDMRLAEIDLAIARMPEAAQRLDAQLRQLRTLETERDAVAARLAAARLDQGLVSEEHGERMVILERAAVPDLPQSSSRRRVAVLGLAASVGVALLLALLLELRRPILRTPRQLEQALGVGAIAVAHRIPTPAERMSGLVRMAITVGILTAGAWYSWQLISPPVT